MVLSTYKSTIYIAVFVKIANAERVQSKNLPGVDTSLTGDYTIRAEDGLEMFKNYTRNLSNF